MRDGFVKVAAATPKIRVADPMFNAQAIIALMEAAAAQGVKVAAFPELCLTGYTCGDLFLQDTLLAGAEAALGRILEATAGLDLLAALGMPVRGSRDCRLYNCAVVICRGEILGVVPKTYLPDYGEFYEGRWFASGDGRPQSAVLCGRTVPLEHSGVFVCREMPQLAVGVELCEDLWTAEPPSISLVRNCGATVILNLSASNEVVGKADYRRQLVLNQSANLLCGYVYANAGEGESTSDLVYAGHNMIAEKGSLLAERRFATGLTVSELDVGKLDYARRRMSTFSADRALDPEKFWRREFSLRVEDTALTRRVEHNPFVPADGAERAARCEDVLTIAALGLKKRLEHVRPACAVIGLSGGLDSTLALLITHRAMALLERPARDILCVTMPCFGTTQRTKNNAVKLAEAMGCALRTVDISQAVTVHLRDLGHSPDDHDVTYENAQARERTQVLMDLANMENGLVIGTGDLSELALGWCTYNGDQMSMYSVNASIPKTLVRHVVAYAADATPNRALADTLRDILDTPVSPELLPARDGEISQKTEDLVGPYELHDFFLYYTLRWGFPPQKVYRLAKYAFAGAYDDAVILQWLRTFYRRFFTQQFKRSASPDGPKVGTVALSPRGDWRMPSDAVSRLWLEDLP